MKQSRRYQIVPAKLSEISTRPPRGVYSGLLDDFVKTTNTGDYMEVRVHEDSSTDTGLTAEESLKVYQGLLQAIRYRKSKGADIPVQVHRSAGRIYLHRM